MEDKRIVKLVERFKAGDREAYDRLYSLLYNRQYYFIYKILKDQYAAEDITQEVFITAYKNIPTIEDPKTFEKWINRISYNCCVDYFRSEKIRSGNNESIEFHKEILEDYNEDNDAYKYTLKKDKNNKVLKAVDELNMSQRATVMLKYFKGLKDGEIAELLDIPVGTVKSRLSNAKKELATKLTGVYTLAPIITIGLKLSSNTLGAMSVTSIWSDYFLGQTASAVAVVGITVGVATYAITSGPIITNITISNPDKYVNKSKMEINIEGPRPLKSVQFIDSDAVIFKEDGRYTAEIMNNGIYTVEVIDYAGKKFESSVNITNIDNSYPELTKYIHEDNHVRLYFADDKSGIAWDNIKFLSNKGHIIDSYEINKDYVYVTLDSRQLPIKAYVEDLAGNYSNYEIDLR